MSLTADLAAHFEKTLEAALDEDANPITEAAKYSLLGGGKRLRPKLLMTTGEIFGADPEACLDAATAVEMIHTYSLIHDDLPAMDDDALRRGKPTLHKAFDEATAILAGDYLLTRSFGVIAQSPFLTDRQKIELIALFSSKAGGQGMIGGQVLDIKEDPNLEKVHLWKTAALIEASILAGGVLAACNPFCLEKLAQFAQKVGLAFQIIDDVIDVETPEHLLGKSAGSDARRKKSTCASEWGLETSRKRAEKLFEEGVVLLSAFPVNSAPLVQLAEELIKRKR